jgi:hypothetical protein
MLVMAKHADSDKHTLFAIDRTADGVVIGMLIANRCRITSLMTASYTTIYDTV